MEILRRSRLDLNEPVELAIHNAMMEVEKAGADVRLTQATILLSQAKNLVADYIEKKPIENEDAKVKPRIELKAFAFQVEQMRMAQTRLEDLLNGSSRESDQAITHIKEMKRQLERVVDGSVKEFKTGNEIRIAPEQVDADQALHNALENSLTQWRDELNQVQASQIDQAISDSKAGAKSDAYIKLEEREKELTKMIAEAEQKLGKVSERVQSPSFNSAVNQILNQAKR
jgi:hypothetical protein